MNTGAALRIGRFFGIPVSVHWTFLLLVAWIIFIQMRAGSTWQQSMTGVAFICCLFICVVLHELGHALAARRYGIGTRSIVLLPIGGIASLESMPKKPAEELWVAVAGPLVNVAIAALLAVVLLATGRMPAFDTLNWNGALPFLQSLMSVNLVLAVFNMLPAFPMDGGRVLRALLSMKLGRVRGTEIAVRVGQFMALVFITVGIFSNPFLVLIALFIMISAQGELAHVRSRHDLVGSVVGDIVMTRFTPLESHNSLGEAAEVLLSSQESAFVVMAHDHPVGTLSRNDLIRGLAQFGRDGLVSQAMNRDLAVLDPATPLETALETALQQRTEIFAVMQRGRLIGILDWNNIHEFRDIQNALRRQPS